MPLSLPFSTLEAYENFVYTIVDRYPSIKYSTLVFVRLDPLAGELVGELHFAGDFVLRVFEIVGFRRRRILKYSYEVYRGTEQLFIGTMTFLTRVSLLWPALRLITNICLPTSSTTACQPRV